MALAIRRRDAPTGIVIESCSAAIHRAALPETVPRPSRRVGCNSFLQDERYVVSGRRRNNMPKVSARVMKISNDACAKVRPRIVKDVSEQSPLA